VSEISIYARVHEATVPAHECEKSDRCTALKNSSTSPTHMNWNARIDARGVVVVVVVVVLWVDSFCFLNIPLGD